MSTLSTQGQPDGASPFDSIRQVRPDGSEFWSGRNLMATVKYSRWEDFAKITERAMAAARNTGADVAANFAPITEKPKMAGRPRQDWELSRFGAYLVVMNGDPNMPEVAAAQAYFATRTREAEVTAAETPDQLLARALIQANQIIAAERTQVFELTAAVEAAAPAVEYVERFVNLDQVELFATFGAQYGLSDHALRTLLIDKKVIYRQTHWRWSGSKQKDVQVLQYFAYAGRQSYQWFDPRPQKLAPPLNNGRQQQTLYIRTAFATELAKYLGLKQIGQASA